VPVCDTQVLREILWAFFDATLLALGLCPGAQFGDLFEVGAAAVKSRGFGRGGNGCNDRSGDRCSNRR